MKLKPQKKLLLKDVVQLLETSRKTINPFYVNGVFLYLMETLEKQKCYDFFREEQKETSGMKCTKEDTRFSKVARMQAHKVTTNVLKKRSPKIFEKFQATIFYFAKCLRKFHKSFFC